MSKAKSVAKGIFVGGSLLTAIIMGIIGLIIGIAFFPLGLIVTAVIFFFAIGTAMWGVAAMVRTVKCPTCQSSVVVTGPGLTCQGCGTRFLIDQKTLEVKQILG